MTNNPTTIGQVLVNLMKYDSVKVVIPQLNVEFHLDEINNGVKFHGFETPFKIFIAGSPKVDYSFDEISSMKLTIRYFTGGTIPFYRGFPNQ